MNTIKKILLYSNRLDGNKLTRRYWDKPKLEKYLLKILKFSEIYYPGKIDSISFGNILYLYVNNFRTLPLCKICGKENKYLTFGQGYTVYCCQACRTRDPKTLEKRINTNIEKYGVKSTMQVQSIQENQSIKSKKTLTEKYGVDSIFKVKSFHEEFQKTRILNVTKKYGVDNVMKVTEIKLKAHKNLKKSNLKKYGVEHVMEVFEFKEKSQKKGN